MTSFFFLGVIMKFQQRDVPIAAIAFFLGVALTLMVLKWRNQNDGWRNSQVPPQRHPGMLRSVISGTPQQVLQHVDPNWQRDSRLQGLERNSSQDRVRKIVAIPVVEYTLNASSRVRVRAATVGPREKIYSFHANRWVPIQSLGPAQGNQGMDIVAGGSGLAHTLPNGDRYVFISAP